MNGDTGYAHSLSTFISKVPDYAGREIVIDGISRFVLKEGLIAEYHESVNGGVAHAQLGLAPERMARVNGPLGGAAARAARCRGLPCGGSRTLRKGAKPVIFGQRKSKGSP